MYFCGVQRRLVFILLMQQTFETSFSEYFYNEDLLSSCLEVCNITKRVDCLIGEKKKKKPL